MDFKALVFDCDGTLADSMPVHYLAWRQTMSRHGIDFCEDRFYSMGGMPTTKIIAILADEAGLVLDIEQVAIEKEDAFHANIDQMRPIEPVVAVAREYRGRVPLAVATGTMRSSAHQVLGQLGVLDWFDALVSCEDVENHKPAPDTYLEAARRLGVSPEDCRAYEDTDIGLQAARSAGMEVVDIRTVHTPRRITPAPS
ncbi:MAG: HAD-IA family hydrolase [Phycisphaerae bacterium]|nr:HAD-IA family hydrolase [Phycisphaerae bacterium]